MSANVRGWLGLLLWVWADSAAAAGLGELSVHSRLNDPLDVSIAVHASPAEFRALSVRLANPEEYRERGLPHLSDLEGCTASLEAMKDGYRVHLTSHRSIREPALDLLVGLQYRGGTVWHNYAVLLDTGPAHEPTAAALPRPGRYVPVKANDTLSGIAQRLARERGVSMRTMMAALFRANPQAFFGGSMDNLRLGAVLAVPDDAAIAAARRAWPPRQRRAASVAPSRASTEETKAAVTKQDGSGSLRLITPESPPVEGVEVPAELWAKVEAVRRETVATQRENAVLRQQLTELEKSVAITAKQILALPGGTPEQVLDSGAAVTSDSISSSPAEAVVTLHSTLSRPSGPLGIDRAWWEAAAAVLLGLGAIGLAIRMWRGLREDRLD